MFGQPSTPFGGGGSTPFGGASNTAPAFGSPAAGGFGAAAPAAPSAGFGAFGAPSPAPATGGFGGFGSTTSNPAPAGGGFGLFGGGGTQTSSTFGAPAASTPFGAPAPAAPTGLFGSPSAAPAGGGLFGAPATATPATSAFGSPPASSFGFGSTAAAPQPAAGTSLFGSTFGAPAPAPGGIFGSTSSATAGFGGNKPAFGAPAQAPSGGLFGAPAPAAPGGGMFGAQSSPAGKGTLIQPFQVTSKQDGNANIALHSISAIPVYESKSFEELRFEDYTAGNKGSAGQSPGQSSATGSFGFGSTGVFGAPAPAPAGLFGAPAPAPAFGAPAPAGGLFGAAAPAPAFGAAPAPAGGGLFGAAAPAPGSFGFGSPAPAAAASSFGSFGAKPPATGLFGAPAPAPGGLFGTAPAPGLFGAPAPAAGAFGAPAPAAGTGLFGAPAPAPSSPFGAAAPATGSLFGQTPAPAPPGGLFGSFGAPAPAPTGLFGATAPAPGSSLFGAAATAPATGLFGAAPPAPAAGSVFGAPAAKPPTTSLFGAVAPAPTTSIFGAPAQPQSAFGFAASPNIAAPTPTQQTVAPQTALPVIPPSGLVMQPTGEAMLAQQLAAVTKQREELEKLDPWRGKAPSGANIIPISLSSRDGTSEDNPSTTALLATATSSSSLTSSAWSSSYTPRSAVRIRPRGFGVSQHLATSETTGQHVPIMSPESSMDTSATRLFIKPSAQPPKPRRRLLLTGPEQPQETALDLREEEDVALSASASTPSKGDDALASEEAESSGVFTTPDGGNDGATPPKTGSDKKGKNEAEAKTTTTTESESQSFGYDYYRQVVGTPGESTSEAPVEDPPAPASEEHLPKLTKPGYGVSPSLEEMKLLSEADLATLSNFVVEREGFGSVAWDGAVDVRGVDIDSVVVIGETEVGVYEEQEKNGDKPEIGTKLNRSAVITMYRIFPKQKDGTVTKEAREKFVKKVKMTTSKMGAELLSYDPLSGIWKFRVLHFSRYGLLFDDDEDDDNGNDNKVKGTTIAEADSAMKPSEGTMPAKEPTDAMVPFKLSKPTAQPLSTPSNTDVGGGDPMLIEPDTSLHEKEVRAMDAAANAYNELIQMEVEKPAEEKPQRLLKEQPERFEDEGEAFGSFAERSARLPPPTTGFATQVDHGMSFTSKIARDVLSEKPSSSPTDYGLRMGRCFRVGFAPDGSFFHPGHFRPGGISHSARFRPAFRSRMSTAASNGASVSSNAERMLCSHLRHSEVSRSSHDLPVLELPADRGEVAVALRDFIGCSSTGREEDSQVAAKAYGLLLALYPEYQEHKSEIDATGSAKKCRRYAVEEWLKSAAKKDPREAERKKDDLYASIFSPLSGGDRAEACGLALEGGNLLLGLMMANGSSDAKGLVIDQMNFWEESGTEDRVPAWLVRDHAVSGGDIGIEEQIFRNGGLSAVDWKKRLGMLLWSAEDGEKRSIRDVVRKYKSDMDAGIAPQPLPNYMKRGVQGGVTSGYYRLLDAEFAAENEVSISSLVAPIGYTPFPHDYSLSFHLGCALGALGVCARMKPWEAAALQESYAAQLILDGKWDWAVVVAMSRMDSRAETVEMTIWREEFARATILRHYNESDGSKRKMLETHVKIPSAWFEEALAYRSLNSDVGKFVQHAVQFDASEAMSAFERKSLPDVLFYAHKSSLADIMTFLSALEDVTNAVWSRKNGCGAVYEYLKVLKQVYELCKLPPSERTVRKDETAHILDRISGLQTWFVPLKESNEILGPSKETVVPPEVHVGEIMATLELCKRQMVES